MDPALLTAAAGLFGSVLGAGSTFSAAWLTHQHELRIRTLAEQARKREAVYSEFILEAAKRFAESWSHQAQTPEVLANLYSALSIMRLISSAPVVGAAEAVVRAVIESYAGPNRTFEDLRQSIQNDQFRDVLQDLIAACQAELATLRRKPR